MSVLFTSLYIANFSGLCSNRATFEVSSEEAFVPSSPLPNFSGDFVAFKVSSEEDRRDADNVVEESPLARVLALFLHH